MDSEFFSGYRKTAVKPTEILMSVCIPYTQQVRKSGGGEGREREGETDRECARVYVCACVCVCVWGGCSWKN